MDIQKTIASTLLDIDPDIVTKFKGYFYRNPICEQWSLIKRVFPLEAKPGDPVLDVGCGNGGLLFYLWSVGYRNIHGADIGELKIRWTRELHSRHGVTSNLTLCDLMSGLDGQYACIFAIGFLYEDPERLRIFLEQCRQRLAPGGQVVFNWPTWQKERRPMRPYYSRGQVCSIARDNGLTLQKEWWTRAERHETALFVFGH